VLKKQEVTSLLHKKHKRPFVNFVPFCGYSSGSLAVHFTLMAPGKIDCGMSVVENYFDALRIEPESCLREERGFT
jgi:hypothetical protein